MYSVINKSNGQTMRTFQTREEAEEFNSFLSKSGISGEIMKVQSSKVSATYLNTDQQSFTQEEF